MSSTNISFEEDSGVIKSGPVIAVFAPIKSRKSYYAVLCERALELHDTEKTYRKGKPARYLIDLSIAFNLHNEHLDPKLKRCVCLMGPDETLCLKEDDGGKGGDESRQNTEWYNAIMSALIPSRVLRLGRPIQPQEFFECAWDVDIVNAPKVKRLGRCEESLQNICVRLPEIAGQKRLCFYAHTIVVCKRRIEPATRGIPSSGIPPFHVDDFFEIPRRCVAFFGCQERFFLMRMGRGSPMGASELWAQCESEEVAHDIHNKLNLIIERESEKKRKMNNGVVMPPGLLSLRSHHGHHRERSHTQPLRQRASSFFNGRVGSPASTPNGLIGRKPIEPSGPFSQPLGSRALSVSYGSHAKSESNSRFNSLMSIFPNRDDCGGVYQHMEVPSKPRISPSTSTTDDTENSGSTICTKRKEGSQSNKMAASQCFPETSEGVTAESPSEQNSASAGSSRGVSLEAINGQNESSTSQYDGYTPMHAAEWSTSRSNRHLIIPPYERYKLEEVRSYVSDSTDSCYSSMTANGPCPSSQVASSSATNPPRAYSFGGRFNLRSNAQQDGAVDNLDFRSDSSNTGHLPPSDDPRKRAFSLGSKTLFQRPFRKISQYSSRQQRHSQTTASGASLASSEVSSSFGPSSSSANHLTSYICSEKDEYARDRSGSFGSGHCIPYYRKGASSSGARDDADHFVEIDFGNGIGRSGSGSVASVDSPNRSRTSSFGCSVRKDSEAFLYLTELPDSVLTPSQIVLQQAKQSSLDESSDYVSTESPDLIAVKNALALAANEHSGHHHSFLSPTDSKSIDLRSSQHFETIEENASLKSSPYSSRSSISVNDTTVEGTEVERSCETDCAEENVQKSSNINENPSAADSATVPCYASSLRSASVTISEITELKPSQTSALGLPKRSSVPTLKSHDTDYSGGVLNYALIQEAGAQMANLRTDTKCDVSGRYRSKSGIIFSHNTDVGNSVLEYASIKPI